LKKFLLGLLTGIILTASGTALADGQIEEITAYLRNDLAITLDGKDLALDNKPIIYNGNTYLPVREMMEYMGKMANWNGRTSKVEIKSTSEKSVTAVTPEGKYIILGQQMIPIIRTLSL
jgi:hypothetical protein